MSRDLGRAVRLAATRTFEELCFVCAEPWDSTEPPPALPHGAAVAFRGPNQGWVELRLSADSLACVAALMLGEEEASALLQQDALGELTNVICGNLLPSVGGRHAVFRLGAPGPLPQTTSEPAAIALLQLDPGAAEIRLHLA